MNKRLTYKTVISALAILAVLTLIAGTAAAQSQKIQGVINGRSGATMTVQTQGAGNVVVLLTNNTQVSDVEGAFHMRKQQMGLTALIPGLPVQVQGSMNAQNQLVADKVAFKASDLKAAQDAQAGLQPTVAAVEQNKAQIAQSEAELKAQQAALAQQQAQLSAEDRKIAANKAAIAAANKRFGELGEYNIMDEVTVYFGNNKVTIDPQYQPQLLKLAQKAPSITGYVIQVKGYASAVGSAAINQKLSQERADAVTNFLEQQGQIPLTNMLAPGAMGTAQQVAPDTTVEGQAENRRVVVMILQNKGIAGQ
jgi:outer membrane protein OmpA-like peptidoglycan-associated protein